MKSFKTHIREAGRSRGEQMEHAIVTAVNGKEEQQPNIDLGAGRKVADALKLKGSAEVLGASQINVTPQWAQYWPSGKVPGSTKTPKTDIKIGKKKISLKTGSAAQLMSGGKNESVATFYTALERSGTSKSDILTKIETAINDRSASSVAAGKLAGEIKKGEDQAIAKADAAHKILQSDLKSLFADDKNFAFHFCYEAMAGEAKFGGNDGTCTHFLTCDFDGNNVHLIPVTNKAYVNKIASRVKPTVRFKTTSVKSKGVKTGQYRYWSVVGLIVDKLTEEIESVGDVLNEGVLDRIIKKIKSFVTKLMGKVKQFLAQSWKNILEFLGFEPDVYMNNTPDFTP